MMKIDIIFLMMLMLTLATPSRFLSSTAAPPFAPPCRDAGLRRFAAMLLITPQPPVSPIIAADELTVFIFFVISLLQLAS